MQNKRYRDGNMYSTTDTAHSRPDRDERWTEEEEGEEMTEEANLVCIKNLIAEPSNIFFSLLDQNPEKIEGRSRPGTGSGTGWKGS